MMSKDANDRQEGGSHYKKAGALQHWDCVALFNLDYFQGNISKYLFRWKDKGGFVDLDKMMHYGQKYIEIEKARAAGTLTRDILTAALEHLKRVDATNSSEELSKLATDTAWDKDRDEAAHKVVTVLQGEKCPLCGVIGGHSDTCTRRKKASAVYCGTCHQVDRHTPDCTAAGLGAVSAARP